MRLAFFGSGAFGLPTLGALSRAHDVVGIVTQPDRPAGRGGHLTPTPIGEWAAQSLPSVPLLKPEKVNTPEVVSTIRAWDVDAWVVIAFGQKLGKALLADRFAVNLHASLLPRWRGAAPINAAILAGDTVTGNSIITLADRMDAGLILAQSRREIGPEQTAGELHDLLSADGPSLMLEVLRQFAESRLRPVTQSDALVTIASKLSKNDGELDFHLHADFLRRQIHALTPWPGVAVALGHKGQLERIKILRVHVHGATHHTSPGNLIDPAIGLVACGHDSTLRLLEVQPAGKRPMPWSDFARGRPLPADLPILSARESGV